MYCPKCGTESSSDLQYCRLCGANLKVIGKAVSLSEAIARSDRGPIPKIKEMMKSLKIEQVTDDISQALDQMNNEIVHSSGSLRPDQPWSLGGKEKKSAQQRREKHLVSGTISLFSGIGLMIFLYFLAGVLVLKLPPDFVARVPFEIEPVVRIIWLLGVMPALTGVGHIIAGLLVRPDAPMQVGASTPTWNATPRISETGPVAPAASVSVTERTTNLLERKLKEDREL